jgi:hypothetical protein
MSRRTRNAPVLTVHVTVEPKVVKVTYEASWDAPPDFGWLSDNDMPLNQCPIYDFGDTTSTTVGTKAP